jgi:hypothetical protein
MLNFIFLPYNLFYLIFFLVFFGIEEGPWPLPAALRFVIGYEIGRDNDD